MKQSSKAMQNFLKIISIILKYAWYLFKHYLLLIWWLLRVEIWIFGYLLVGRWLFGLRLYFPRYYDVWFKNKKSSTRSSRSSLSSGYSFSVPKLPENTLHKNNGKKSENKIGGSNIYKVKNGLVHTLSQYGGQVRAPFHPSAGGDAIFVDYNPNLDRLVVTTERGTIGIYDTNGGQRSSFGVTDAIMARWQGDDIFVKLKNGNCLLYNKNGGKLRYL